MKKIYTFVLTILSGALAYAQTTCPVQVQPGPPILCFGQCTGSATAFGTGSPPFTYSWMPSNQTTQTATGLCAGTYSVMVVNGSGCTGFGSVTITQPSQIFIAVGGTQNTSCTACNGSLTANVTGGTPPYSYSWTSNPSQSTATATGLCGGVYYVTVTDANGCTAMSVGTVGNSSSIPQAVTTGSNPTNCINCNGSVFGSATGGTTPYTYLWAPGGQTTQSISGQCAGTYTLTVTDANGCTSTSTWTLTAPGVSFTTSSSNATGPNCNNGSGTASPSNPGNYSYSWTPSGQTTQTATGLSAGTHTVCVTNTQNGCQSCSTITVSCLTGIEEHIPAAISVYPNPADEQISVLAEKEAELELFNMVGEQAGKWLLVPGKNEIGIAHLPAGIYFLRSGNTVRKITIQ
ncbi:MAG: T9SS type A sorting domain-containing protein [Bacteroidota bacterium]